MQGFHQRHLRNSCLVLDILLMCLGQRSEKQDPAFVRNAANVARSLRLLRQDGVSRPASKRSQANQNHRGYGAACGNMACDFVPAMGGLGGRGGGG